MKRRWISLILVLVLVLAVFSVCAAAADTTAEEEPPAEPALESEQTPEESEPAEALPEEPTEAEEPEPEEAEEPDLEETEEEAQEETREQPHIHAVNRQDACEEPAFAPLSVTGGRLESGCYYLTEDLALDEPLCVPKNGAQVTLCLNGHTLSLADGAEGCIIYVAISDAGQTPSNLTITDCNGAQSTSNYYVGEAGELVFDDGSFSWQEAYIAASEKHAMSGGRITGATAGAISVGEYNTLVLTNVNLVDNEGRYGAGLVIAEHASAVLDNCIIAGNRLTGELKASERQISGGGVYCAGTLELSGTTCISGNCGREEINNLQLDQTGSVSIGTLGLDAQAQIGIRAEAEQTILSGYADDFSKNFTSDDATLCVVAVQENGFTTLCVRQAVYTLTLAPGEQDETLTLEVEQGRSLSELEVQPPERDDAVFAGWFTDDETQVDEQTPLHLTADTTLYAHWTPLPTPSEAEQSLQADAQAPLTRQEAAKTLYRLAGTLGLDLTAGEDIDLSWYEDAQEIDEDAKAAVRWVCAMGLLSAEDGKLHGTEVLTQEELASLLAAFYALVPTD